MTGYTAAEAAEEVAELLDSGKYQLSTDFLEAMRKLNAAIARHNARSRQPLRLLKT